MLWISNSSITNSAIQADIIKCYQGMCGSVRVCTISETGIYFITLLPESSTVSSLDNLLWIHSFSFHQVEWHCSDQQLVESLHQTSVIPQTRDVSCCSTHVALKTRVIIQVPKVQQCGNVGDTNLCYCMLNTSPRSTLSCVSSYSEQGHFVTVLANLFSVK